MSMESRHAAPCVRSGDVGQHRQIDDVIGLFLKRIVEIVLRDRCADALG